MTRINADLDPRRLTDQHLLAEYRELPMVPAALRRSLRTKSVGDVLQSVPGKFTLNKGHVSFFYNKLAFLESRYSKIVSELQRRGVKVDTSRTFGGEDIPYVFYGKAEFDKADRRTIIARIKERVAEKPEWYKLESKQIDFPSYINILEGGINHG